MALSRIARRSVSPERPDLISAHEAAVAFHVGREDCHQSTIEFHRF